MGIEVIALSLMIAGVGVVLFFFFKMIKGTRSGKKGKAGKPTPFPARPNQLRRLGDARRQGAFRGSPLGILHEQSDGSGRQLLEEGVRAAGESARRIHHAAQHHDHF